MAAAVPACNVGLLAVLGSCSGEEIAYSSLKTVGLAAIDTSKQYNDVIDIHYNFNINEAT